MGAPRRGPAAQQAAAVRSSWSGRSQPPPFPGHSRHLTLPLPSCSERGRQGGGLDAARSPRTHPAALRSFSLAGSTAAGSPACTILLPDRVPAPALPLSSRGHHTWLFRCSRSLGTAGAGCCKFTVCLDDVAQTQHVIEWLGLRSRVYITEKTVRNNHQCHKAFTRTQRIHTGWERLVSQAAATEAWTVNSTVWNPVI